MSTSPLPPEVATDSSEYIAGDAIAITGAGFAPAETLTLQVTHADGGAEAGMGHEGVAIVADETGGFSASWTIAPADTGGNDFVVHVTGATAGATAAAFKRVAHIRTDKPDYQPGETAGIAGRAFDPGESVTLRVIHLTGGQDDGAGHEPFSVEADEAGQLAASWHVDTDDSHGSTFLLTATGASSGRTATTTFTDAVGTPPDDVADAVYGQLGSFTASTINNGGRSADSLFGPSGVAPDRDGNLYVADNGNSRILMYPPGSTTATRVYGQLGSFTTGFGNAIGGTPSANNLLYPESMTLDAEGNLYVADRNNNRVLFFPAGNTTATRVYGQGGDLTTNLSNNPLPPDADSLSGPYAVVVDRDGNLYVSDHGNNRVLFFTAGSTTPTRVYGQLGEYTTLTANKGGRSADTLFGPRGLALDSDGNLYVADRNNHRVLVFSPGSTTATRVYGPPDFVTPTGGTSATLLVAPEGVAVDRRDNLYVADTANSRVLFFPAGSTTATYVYGQDGSFTTATPNKGGISADSLSRPSRVAIDRLGNLLVADRNNNRVLRFDRPPDTIAPSAAPLQSPAANAAGWNNTDVSIDWLWADDEEGVGVDPESCPQTSTSAGEGHLITVTTTCSDLAGNTAETSVDLKVDKTPPTISAATAPAPNVAGWYRDDVVVAFTCADALSGVVTCPAQETLTAEGAAISSSTPVATDAAGNDSAPSSAVVVSIDRTAPVVGLSGGPAHGGSYPVGGVPAAPTCTATDVLSGLDGACTVSGYGTTAGTHTVTAMARDNAGNQASVSATYTVAVSSFSLLGFYQPVDMGGVWNVVKAGATVPLKFEVFDGATEVTSASGVIESLAAVESMCSGGPSDDVEVVATGGTSLRYDAGEGRFIYNWQTPKKAGFCYAVTVRVPGGSTLTANFRLK